MYQPTLTSGVFGSLQKRLPVVLDKLSKRTWWLTRYVFYGGRNLRSFSSSIMGIVFDETGSLPLWKAEMDQTVSHRGFWQIDIRYGFR